MTLVMNFYVRMGTVCSEAAYYCCFSPNVVCVSLHALLHLSSFTHVYKDPEPRRRKTRKIKCCKIKALSWMIMSMTNV